MNDRRAAGILERRADCKVATNKNPNESPGTVVGTLRNALYCTEYSVRRVSFPRKSVGLTLQDFALTVSREHLLIPVSLSVHIVLH